MTRHEFTADQKITMLALYTAGQTLTEIAAVYGCIPQTVSRYIKELDASALRPKGRWSRFTETQKFEVLSRYSAGETARQIGESFSCSVPTILRILREQDPKIVRPSGPAKFTEEQKQEMSARYRDGESLKALAKVYDCSWANIHQILKNRGVVSRPLGLPPLSDEVVERIRVQRLAGRSYRQIGELLELHSGTIGDVCRNRLGLSTVDLDDTELMGVLRGRGSLPREDSPAWQGGRTLKRGYALVALEIDDPLFCMVQVNGYVYEHRIVMARALGRPLTAYETVHHINGDSLDNEPDNLQLRVGNHGKGAAMECLDCGSHNLGFVPLK